MKKTLFILFILLFCGSAHADKWIIKYERLKNITPTSISYGDESYLITFSNGDWWNFHKSFLHRSVFDLRLNTTGSFYYLINDKNEWQKKTGVKWKENKKIIEKKESLPITTNPIIKKTIVETEKISPSWIKVSRELPSQNVVVLVEFSDSIRTTAYLNLDNEWKLNTDRNNFFGGETLKLVTKWRIIED